MKDVEFNNEIQYRRLFNSSNDAILLMDASQFLDCNDKACEYFQYTKEELLSLPIGALSPENQSDGDNSVKVVLANIKKTILSGTTLQLEWQLKRKDGNLFDVSATMSVVELKGVKCIQTTLRDISELKRLHSELEAHKNNLEKLVLEKTKSIEQTLMDLQNAKAQMVQSEKMASLGVLTAGVAHEINNPLNFIMGGYIGLKDYFNEVGSNDPEKTDYLLSSIKSGIERASEIVKGLKDFSRENELFSEECSIHSIINNCLIILKNEIKQNNVAIIKNFFHKNITVNGNVGKLHQIFINIISNANQAIEKGGEIIISTHKGEKKSTITITDNGEGISERNLLKITDPFFSTKAVGKGTGLGLSISYNLLKQHNATIEFESKLKHGTKVTLTFPNKNITKDVEKS